MASWPKTPEEWQEAIDAATAMRAIADCKMYGLIEGGPEANLLRCDAILLGASKRGIVPSKPVEELVMDLVTEINREADLRGEACSNAK